MALAHWLALLALAGAGEIAWWEGRWVGPGMSCAAQTGDRRPFVLAWNRLELGEAECRAPVETAVPRGLRLRAACREHGEPRWAARSFILRPSDGGRAMAMSSGGAVWQLRKCRRAAG